MAVNLSDAAVELIARSLAQAGLDPASAGVRLRVAGGEVRPRFAAGPEPDDEVVSTGGVLVFVAPGVADGADVEVGVSAEHDTLTVSRLQP